jgi:hypothetical protein
MYLRTRQLLIAFIGIGCIGVAYPVVAIVAQYIHLPSWIEEAISWILLTGITIVQVCYVQVLAKNRTQFYKFYCKLSKSRTTLKAATDLTESYRHLREHGNSLLIVVLEIVLAAVLWGIRPSADVMHRSIIFPAFAILLWTIPGTVAWFAGSIIETRFANDPHWQKEPISNPLSSATPPSNP